MASQTPIPQNPIGESFAWREWFQRLSDRVFGTAASIDVPIQPEYGGTGLTTYNTGDIIYSNATNNLTRLAGPAATSFLQMNASGVPSWTTGGVASIIAGSGISVSSATGNITVTAIGTGTSAPRLEAYDLATSIAINNTPTLLIPASTIAGSTGITYNNTTGVFTFTNAGTYTLAISLNITTTNANQFVYVYAENNTGSGWVVNANSGKDYDLVNGQTVQYTNPQAVYRSAGQQVRYWIYSNGTTSSLVTQTLPGVSGVYVPAIRIQYTG